MRFSDLAFQNRFEYTHYMADVRRSWDKIADHYSRRYKISTDNVHYGPLCPGDDILGLIGNIKGKKVVDLGCGAGQNAIALARQGGIVTAVDFSEKQIGQARGLAKKNKVKIDFRVGDIGGLLSQRNNGFDLAVSACAISFVKNIDKAFASIFRILKRGGKFILSDMNPLQYIIDQTDDGVTFNSVYPYNPITINWDWEFDQLDKAPDFHHYVRSISSYFNSLTSNGFVVSKILEPKSTMKTPHIGFSKEIMEEYGYIARHIPITFIIVCGKP